MLVRPLQLIIKHLAKKLPVIGLFGSLGSGKTTLATTIFTTYRYINFEDLNQRSFALADPQRFLADNLNEYGIIFDEIQHVPALLSYIQLEVDRSKKNGYFIITGSQNFLLNQAITQSLAGRIAIINLLPLSLQELRENKLLSESLNKTILDGGYPRLYANNLAPSEFYPFYIQTYIERDVRQITNVTNLITFQRFLKLCAGRVGQLLNISSLANDCGISATTARGWLSILEASYLIFQLQPYYKNFSKRVIKASKLYFYDTGIACSLLGIQSEEDVALHYLRRGLVESLIISDLMKHFFNKAQIPPLYFWRDSQGHEIDCIIEQGQRLIPVEIKAGQTINTDYFTGLKFWSTLTETDPSQGFVVYAGMQTQHRSQGTVLSWQSLDKIFV
jgi:uncharacterized protein